MDEGNRWDWMRIGYPFASAVILSPLCLIVGWYWVALTVALLGAVIVVRYFWMRSIATIPLFMLCFVEVLIALNLIVYELKNSMKPGG